MIGALLDAGADGVRVPQVSTRAEAQAAVDAARFSPIVIRGANSWVGAADFAGAPDWFSKANDNVAAILMIERESGVDNTRDIDARSGLDGIFLGSIYLAHTLGIRKDESFSYHGEDEGGDPHCDAELAGN